MAAESEPKWEGKAIVELPGKEAESAWSAIQDFCNLHKWIPLDTCYYVEGIQGQPGLIRYCASTVKDPESQTPTIKWAKEKLLTIDPIQHSLSYEVGENNMGFNSYVGTFQVLPLNGDPKLGCKIEWGFLCDPVEGWTFQALNSYIENALQFMANKIHLACSLPA
ncbi:hypothetical protein VNO77_11015 [Canavalia gladiata]|uniref:Lachrymatory-factor synthase-like n=1 Tax=Canavalia gladiata TaxID=3824 RepID=A0AAN9MHL5_CANGL